MDEVGAKAYLVNTGWNGTGKRISLKETRAIISAILDGSIEDTETEIIPGFDLVVPKSVEGVNPQILDPRDTYTDVSEWEDKAKSLADLFRANFEQYTDTDEGQRLLEAQPKF